MSVVWRVRRNTRRNALKPSSFHSFGECPHVAKRTCRLKRHGWRRWPCAERFATGHLQQAADHRIEFAAELIESPQSRNGALLHPPGIVPIGLDELDVATGAGGRDLDMHAITLAALKATSMLAKTLTNVPPQEFSENRPETRRNTEVTSQNRVFGAELCELRWTARMAFGPDARPIKHFRKFSHGSCGWAADGCWTWIFGNSSIVCPRPSSGNLARRMQDGVIKRLIGKWLQAGVMEEGVLTHSDVGTPQGGVVSPLLANIYLHEVLDVCSIRW